MRDDSAKQRMGSDRRHSMEMTAGTSRAAIAALALSLALVGCDSKSNEQSATATTTTTIETSAQPAPPSQNAPASNQTIASYVQENGITETRVRRGDPGAPTVDVPVPDGWANTGPETPKWTYDAIVYKGPEAADYTPSVVALVSKLTGNVDPQKIIDLAPGELNNLNGFTATGEGRTTELSGFPAYQLAGTWVQDGKTKVVAQKTVVIPGSDGVYVLQLNADGLENQMDIVSTASNVIDDQINITP
jgi:hypothetical protein